MSLFGPTQPVSRADLFRAEGFDATLSRFLTSEEAATARLMGFYRQARLEITDLLRSGGNPSASDVRFFESLRGSTDEIVSRLQNGSVQWANGTIGPAFVEGARTQNADIQFTPIHDTALQALSQDTLALITNTNEGIRRSVQQAVASGILEGLSPDEIRNRMIAGGLQPGPWKTVEERAGVIARTETMRAYNAGNIVGAQSTGAPVVEWIASPDEKTCPICLPLDGHRFATPGLSPALADQLHVPAEWRHPLPPLPRHPRCRCTIKSIFRGADGQVFNTVDAAQPAPITPPAGVVAQAEQAAIGQATRLDQLQEASFSFVGNEATRQAALLAESYDSLEPAWARMISREAYDALQESRTYWRSIDLTPELRAEIARLQPQFDGLLALRYGIRVNMPTPRIAEAFSEEQRLRVLNAIEAVRDLVPRYVVDSDRFLLLNINAETGSALASASASGTITYDAAKLEKYLTRDLRIAPGQAVEEVVVHEIGHEIANRYGEPGYTGATPKISYGRPPYWSRSLEKLTGGDPTPTGRPGQTVTTIPAAEQKKLFDEWAKIRKNTSRLSSPPNFEARPSYVLELAEAEAKVAEFRPLYQEAVKEWQAEPGPTRFNSPAYQRMNELGRKVQFWASHESTFRRRIAEIDAAKPGDNYHVSDYGRGNPYEDFAESWAMYVLNPAKLRELSPARYEFMKRIAEGRGG